MVATPPPLPMARKGDLVGKRRLSTISGLPMPLASVTCMAMFLSGAKITGMTPMTEPGRTAAPGYRLENPMGAYMTEPCQTPGYVLGSVVDVLRVAARGASTRGSAAPRTATGARPSAGATSSGSAWPARLPERGSL